jgi:hypothetical protein
MPETEKHGRELARQQAWYDFENAALNLMKHERMKRLKADYSIYGDGPNDFDGTVEFVCKPKKIVRKSIAARGGRVR